MNSCKLRSLIRFIFHFAQEYQSSSHCSSIAFLTKTQINGWLVHSYCHYLLLITMMIFKHVKNCVIEPKRQLFYTLVFLFLFNSCISTLKHIGIQFFRELMSKNNNQWIFINN
eukprot:GHVR01116611.1.p2 GENE.GHVR01116611.1~~GHVR01116611.1.p2  ORF type:complete len:113 (+),score=0.97 GHVR01116611.1:1123-1461(+)